MGCLRIPPDQRPELRVVHAKQGVPFKKGGKRVCSSGLFGMLMPDRHNEINGNPYTYCFQGQEWDDEVKVAGNAINFKFRMHDLRLGRFLSVDPFWLSAFCGIVRLFLINKVIQIISEQQ